MALAHAAAVTSTRVTLLGVGRGGPSGRRTEASKQVWSAQARPPGTVTRPIAGGTAVSPWQPSAEAAAGKRPEPLRPWRCPESQTMEGVATDAVGRRLDRGEGGGHGGGVDGVPACGQICRPTALASGCEVATAPLRASTGWRSPGERRSRLGRMKVQYGGSVWDVPGGPPRPWDAPRRAAASAPTPPAGCRVPRSYPLPLNPSAPDIPGANEFIGSGWASKAVDAPGHAARCRALTISLVRTGRSQASRDPQRTIQKP